MDDTFDTDLLPLAYSVNSSNNLVSLVYGRKFCKKSTVDSNIHHRALSAGITEDDNYDELNQAGSNPFENPVNDFNITIGGGISIPIWNFSVDQDAAYTQTKLTKSLAS